MLIMAGHLSIFSLNSRGLRDKKKRENLFYWLKEKNAGIIFLQETYWTEDILSNIEKEWGSKILLSQGTQHSKGTAILFSKNINLDLLNVHRSDDGRMILANIKIEDKNMTLINIYAPNNQNDRKSFFNKVLKWSTQYSTNIEEIIMGGDYNCVESHKLDRNENTQYTTDTSLKSYLNLKEKLFLSDVWREMQPHKKQYTYLEKSRLDKFLVTQQCSNHIQRTKIFTSGIKSDHKCISVELNFNSAKKGPGRWKLNTSILNDFSYKQKVSELIQSVKQNFNYLSKQMIWEVCKVKIKELTIAYCTKKQSVKKCVIKDIESKLEQKEQELINSNFNQHIKAEKDNLADTLYDIVEKQKEGAKIRSRARWLEEGERPTKYFFNLEKKNISNNTIKELKTKDGVYVNSNKEILEEQYKFYNQLYEADNINEENIKKYLSNINNLNILNENEVKLLEGEISENECKIALKNMKLNKSPGSDGIPVEFYLTFWEDVKQMLLESINSAYHMGELSPSQKKGILSLIFKKGDKTLLENWRPISLLNTDYKILAHALANRLKKVISKLIHTDQSGYIKGRTISTNIRLIQDVIDFFEENETDGAIVFLDFKKAFDTVSHDFLNHTLTKFNFGASFKKWVNVMYKNAESSVTNNGWQSKPLKIKKGIRQGCPLSALLFLLVAEILAMKIRNEPTLGLKININDEEKCIQISQLADDTTLFLKNENAVVKALDIVEDFGNVSGLKLNIRKTEGLWLGRGRNRNDTLGEIKWDNNSIQALGIYFGYNKQEIEEKNWHEKIENIKKCLKFWNCRDLSLQGRVLIIKTLALSKVVYLINALTVPKWVINTLNKEFFSFLWRYKRDKIARKVVINEIENGGLNMLDFKAFCIAAKAAWACKLLDRKNETWGITPNKYFEACDFPTVLCMNNEKEKHIPIELPVFYKDLIHSWHLCGGGQKAPQDANDIRKEIIWGNKFIQTRGKTLYYKHWKESNFNFVEDLLNAEGKFKSGEEVFHKLNKTQNWLTEYMTIQKAIPKTWKDCLKTCNMQTKVKQNIKPFININNKILYDLPKKSCEFYKLLMKQTCKKSHMEKYWTNLFQDTPLWKIVYENRIKNIGDKKLADFHFKLIHKILPSQENLFKWKISNSNNCRFGCTQVENYNHLFISCPKVQHLITSIENTLKHLGFTLKMSMKTLIFGHKLTYKAYSDVNKLISYIFYNIYKYWLKNDSSINLTQWVLHRLKQLNTLYHYTKDNFSILNKFIDKRSELDN